VRVAAFVHRLLLVATAAVDPVATAALVATARAVLVKYPPAHQLLEGDEDRAAARGAFKPLGVAVVPGSGLGLGSNGFSGLGVGGSGGGSGALTVEDTPELTNPLAAAAWELAALTCHWHPTAAHQARAAAALSLPGAHDNPVLLLKGLAAATLFHPPWHAPPPSPMHALVAKQTAQKHARQRRPVFLRVDSAAPLAALLGAGTGVAYPEDGEGACGDGAAPPLLDGLSGGSADACGKALRGLFRGGERQRLEAHLHRARWPACATLGGWPAPRPLPLPPPGKCRRRKSERKRAPRQRGRQRNRKRRKREGICNSMRVVPGLRS
jgi:hypothetical protein